MSNAPLFVGQHDPADVADYVIRFDDLLAPSQAVTLTNLAIDATSAAAGLAVGSGAYAAFAIGTQVKFWLTCSTPNDPAFAAGIMAVVTATVATSSSPPSTYQRSVLVRVVQSDALTAPLSLAEAKAHLRIVDNDENDHVLTLIRAAADKIENNTGLVLRQRAVTVTFDGFYTNGIARLPLWAAPLVSVTSVVYDDANGVEQTLAGNQYRVRQFAGVKWIVPAHGVTWPNAEPGGGTVRVTYEAGYANNDAVPAAIRQAAFLLIGHWYENREAVNIGNITSTVPLAFKALTGSYRQRWVI